MFDMEYICRGETRLYFWIVWESRKQQRSSGSDLLIERERERERESVCECVLSTPRVMSGERCQQVDLWESRCGFVA